MLTIFAHTQAGELDLVLPHLDHLGVPWLRVNLDDLAYRTPLRLRIRDGAVDVVLHHPVRGDVELASTKLAWAAYMPNYFHREVTQLSSPLAIALQNDLQALVLSVDLLLSENGTSWINRIREVLFYSKAYDLVVAHDAGFSVPRTIVAGYCSEATVMQRGAGWIYKTLFSQTIDYDASTWMAAYTRRVDDEMIEILKNINRKIKAPPLIFQERVAKMYEVRTFFFGDRQWSVKIDSQSAADLYLDWRVKPELALDCMSRYDLPEEVGRRAAATLKRLNLTSGAFDFIVRPDGEWVFLEVNRTPSWNWMSRPLDENLALGIAKELSRVYSDEKNNTCS